MYKRSFNPCDDCRYGIEKRDGSGHDSMCKICEFNHLTAITADIPDLEALCNAWRENRCVVSPCKVGNTVYVDTKTFLYGERNAHRHAEALVTSFALGTKKRIKFRIFSPYVNQNKVFNYPLSAFGKTVFLTREAADAALCVVCEMEGEKE